MFRHQNACIIPFGIAGFQLSALTNCPNLGQINYMLHLLQNSNSDNLFLLLHKFGSNKVFVVCVYNNRVIPWQSYLETSSFHNVIQIDYR